MYGRCASFLSNVDSVNTPGPGLDQNHAGGFVHKISDFARFKRFLVLGADANTFYASANELTLENARVILELLKANNGLEMVNEIVSVSQAGRAPRQSPGIFALAVIISFAKPSQEDLPQDSDTPEQKIVKAAKEADFRKVKQEAMKAIPKVCRTASTLYELLAYHKVLDLADKPEPKAKAGMGKWNHSLRKAVGDWYLDKSPLDVAMQVTKYKTRNEICSRDLMRLAHPKADKLGKRKRESDVADMQLVLKYTVKPDQEIVGEGVVAEYLRDVQRLKKARTAEETVSIISRQQKLGWEHVGESALLKKPEVWAALLDQGMGLTALIRNLNRFLDIKLLGNAKKRETSRYGGWGALGALSIDDSSSVDDCEMEETDPAEKEAEKKWAPEKDYLQVVIDKLTSKEALVKGRIHPLRVLLAQATLNQKYLGPTIPSKLKDALQQSFQLSFASSKPTGKKFLIAMDVSGSMGSPCSGSDVLTCREATAAVTFILNKIESDVKIVAFCDCLTDFPIRQNEKLQDVIKRMGRMPFGGTDCSLPIRHAIEKKLDVDVFVVLTDSETWMGQNVSQCLRQYRATRPDKTGNEAAKMMVCAFSGTEFSIADPMDAGMLDVAGFDSALPEIMEDFVLGNYATSKM